MDENIETQVKESLQQLPTTQQESDTLSRHEDVFNIYDYVAVTGIRVDRVEPGLVVSTFKVPPRLTVSSLTLALTLKISSFWVGFWTFDISWSLEALFFFKFFVW